MHECVNYDEECKNKCMHTVHVCMYVCICILLHKNINFLLLLILYLFGSIILSFFHFTLPSTPQLFNFSYVEFYPSAVSPLQATPGSVLSVTTASAASVTEIRAETAFTLLLTAEKYKAVSPRAVLAFGSAPRSSNR